MSALKYWDQSANNGNGAWQYLAQGVKGDKGAKGDTGATGQAGTNGTNGQGVPTGGSTGYALVKKSGTDYDTGWQAITTGVSSVDNLTGAVSLASSYDAKGTAVLKSKFNAFLAKATGPINAFPAANNTGITVTNSAVSGATVYAYNSGKFYYRGLVPSVVTNSGVSYYRNDPISHLSFNVFWVEFDHYGTNFDVRHSRADENKYAQIWVWVDGVPVTTQPSSVYSVTGALAYYNVSFAGDAKQRRIRVMVGAADFAGIGLASDKDTIFPVEQKLLKVVFFGGSWFDGGSGVNGAYTQGTVAATYDSGSNIITLTITGGTSLVKDGDQIDVTGLTYTPSSSATGPFTVTGSTTVGGTTIKYSAPTGTTGISGTPVVAAHSPIAYLNDQLSVQLGEMMNVDYYVNAWGGTGYYNGIAVIPPNNWSDASRINPIINTVKPDLVVFFGTTNDDFTTYNNVYTQAASTYSQLLTGLPNTKLIVFTRQSNTITTTGTGTGTAINESAVTAAANSATNVIGVVNPWTEQWVNGTAWSGGTGNGSIYIYSDNHPTPIGNRYYATRTFNRIVDIIKTYTRS